MDFELGDVDAMKSGIRQRSHISREASNVINPRDGSEDIDRSELARVGKRQVLKRNFDLVSMIGFSSTLVSLWENVLLSSSVGLTNGGPAGLIYGFIFVWAGIICVYITLGELASMIPTSGGQYHWVSILAPEKAKKPLSYICGWLTILGWVGAIAATSFFTSSNIQALIAHNQPDYDPKGWQITLIQWAILSLVLLFNTVLSKTLPAIEVILLIIHLLGFFAVLIPILYLSPKENAGAVFTNFQNNGGWNTQALAWFVGLSGNAAAFVGADGAVHMSEEIKNATKNVPRSIVYSTIFNGVMALAMLITFIICAGEITDAESKSPYPYIPIFARLVGQNAGATIMVCLVITLQFCACIAATATSSRLMWAFARDRGLPNWKQLSQINTKTTIPVKSLLVGIFLAALLGLIAVGSTTAFNALISLAVTLYISYLLTCGLLLYRRVRGEIGILDPEDPNLSSEYKYTWGPWRIPGVLGIITNTLACMYLILIAFFTFWPPFAEVTAQTMNYGSVVFVGASIVSGVYYFARAHKVYKGPLVEVVYDGRLFARDVGGVSRRS